MSVETNNEAANRTEAQKAEETETTTNQETGAEVVEVDLENEKVKAAISSKVEEVVGARVGREKSKTDAAEAKAKAAEEKLAKAEETITALTSEKTKVEKERDEFFKNSLILEVSIQENVKPEMVKRLKGDTKEDLVAAIEAVRGSVKGSASVDRIFDGKDTGKTTGKSLREIALKAAARSS